MIAAPPAVPAGAVRGGRERRADGGAPPRLAILGTLMDLWFAVGLGALAGLDAWLLGTGRRGGTALFFALLAALATWPLIASLDQLPANASAPADARLFLWDLWWVKTALAAGENPLRTDLLFAPHGTALVFHGLALPQALATLPLQALRPGLAGLTLAYGAVVLGSFMLAGWAAHRLALRVVGDPGAALFCGAAFTLQSLHFASTVRFHALAIEWLPIVVLALLRALERGRVRDGVWLGLAFAAAFYASVEYAYFLLIVGASLVAFEVWVRGERAAALGWWWRAALVAAVVAGLVTAPFWRVFFEEIRLTATPVGDHVGKLAPDLLDLVVPHPGHSLLAGPIGARRASLGLRETPTAVFLGWTLLALAAAGVARAWRKREGALLVWLGIAVVFAALMLGPSIQILGHDTGIPGPYALLERVLPFFEQARMPMRFGAVTQLGLALLAAHALAGWRARLSPARGAALASLAIAAVVFESLRAPLAMATPEVPEAYRRVAAASEPRETVLLDWPPGLGESAEIEGLHQIVHGQRLVQDLPLFLPRAAAETRRTAHSPTFAHFVNGVLASPRLERASDSQRPHLVAAMQSSRRQLGIRHVVLRRHDLPPEVYRRGRDQLRLLEPAETFEDEDAFLASFDD